MSEADAKPTLLDESPDLFVQLRRDGRILRFGGGYDVRQLIPGSNAIGQDVDLIWPPTVAVLVKQLVRKTLASRMTVTTRFSDAGVGYEIRVAAQSPDRVLCIIRADAKESDIEVASPWNGPGSDRRGFLRNFQAALSKCLIAEKPAAVAVIILDGLNDISRMFDPKISAQIVSAAIERIGRGSEQVGEISEGLLGIVLQTSDRVAMEESLSIICDQLRKAISVGDGVFHLTPYAGVAILGRDSKSAKGLLDHAVAAATEARRSGSTEAHFFSDTLKLRSLARLDITRELHDAIAQGEIEMRYVGRYDLSTGSRVALVSYVRWNHPLRGEVPPKDFLSVAEASGVAITLSRAMLQSLRETLPRALSLGDETTIISFGPLRHHLLHDDFIEEIQAFLAVAGLLATRFEIRIAERTFVILGPTICDRLYQLGIAIVIDEVAREMASFGRLAQAPLSGLQLDRVWVEALRSDPVAFKVCHLGIHSATALGLRAIATGVDNDEQRRALLELGCGYGMGDLYENPGLDVARQPPYFAPHHMELPKSAKRRFSDIR